MKAVVLALITSASMFAALDGVVTNQTTGKPQSGVEVSLVKLGQGMDTVGTVKSVADGKFHFAADLDAAAPYLVQASFEGVHYNKVLPPAAPRTSVAVDVFNASAKVPDAKIAAHMILIQPSDQVLNVNESLEYQNAGKVTLNDEKNGTVRFYLPAGVSDVQVSISAPGGMPIQRPAEKTSTPNVYAVKYPVKPGETRFDLAYQLPSAKELTGKSVSGEKISIVVPKGVKIQGDELTSRGVEPSTQAEIFDTPVGKAWKFSIEGTGTLRGGNDNAQNADAGSSEDNGFSVEEGKPLIYSKLPWMLACAGAIFILGFAILYRSDATASSTASPKKK